MKINIKKVLLNVYLSLFIFCMINREFLLFGLDLRFILVPLGLLLIGSYILFNRGKIHFNHNKNSKQFNYLILFYLWVFLSNISWLWNGLPIKQVNLINELILIVNIFISIIVMKLYEDKISSSYIKKNIIISSLILVISIILVSMGFTASQISASLDVSVKYTTANGVTHTNLFGWNFRPAGYASDPNYATLLLIIACCCVLKLKTSKLKKIVLLVPVILGISLAFSKTILVAVLFAIIYILFLKSIVKNKKTEIFLTTLLLIIAIGLSVICPFITDLKNFLPQTMTTRLMMWKSAVELFFRSPLIGSGITSFRSFFSINHWYIHAHNTYLQILSETGVIGSVFFYLLIVNTIKINHNNIVNFFMTIVFIIFMITYETIALQFFVYVVLLCHIGKEDVNDEKEKK